MIALMAIKRYDETVGIAIPEGRTVNSVWLGGLVQGLQKLSPFLVDVEDYHVGLTAIREAYDMDKRLPKSPSRTGTTLFQLGVLLYLTNDFNAALPVTAEAVEVLSHLANEDRRSQAVFAMALASFGRTLLRLGRREDARTALRASAENLQPYAADEQFERVYADVRSELALLQEYDSPT